MDSVKIENAENSIILKNVMAELMNKDNLRMTAAEKFDQYYYGHGKLLLTGEYFILDGAQGLALPTCVGQSMGIRYEQSYSPKLNWKSYDVHGNLWLEANFEFWHFNILDENPSEEVIQLQKILKQARIQNKHFLRDSQDVYVQTQLGFPREWGLGSSSTLLYNTAQWAYTSPFELAKETFGGSGYDIACAGSDGPIIYHLEEGSPHWSTVSFFPEFHENLYFVYLGSKQNTRDSINEYRKKYQVKESEIERINQITSELVNCVDFNHFCDLIAEHEQLVSGAIGVDPIAKKFSDFKGSLKSLGAWGGDFILAGSEEMNFEEVQNYFSSHGLKTVIPFKEFILPNPQVMANQSISDMIQ